MSQRVLVIPDGLAETPPGDDGATAGPTTLERTATPALDAIARRGAVRPVAVTPEGLHPGSETGIPTLLGWTPERDAHGRPRPLSRGRIDAAAHGLREPDGAVVHRVDVRHADGRPWPELGDAAATLLRGAGGEEALHVQRLSGHRIVVFAHTEPLLGGPALLRDLVRVGAAAGVAGVEDPDDPPRLQLWADGALPPPLLDERETTVVCAARSTAAGIARLLGAATVHPSGATGDAASDLPAKARAAVALLRAGTPMVVVHVGGPDEASHARDRRAKARVLQQLDRDLLAPLAGVALDLGATLAVCPDHGTDPDSGRHTAAPVPAVVWGPAIGRRGPERVTERGVAGLAAVGSPWAP
ncbi:hypothetical protein [Patulibacter defluvii]|uniref:hypothetical protein n=1 Tax=Patulibacter defluvii TaxID=3095358 RepID=UPI002A76320F|nr:hypothetical protein [Patulibacter sp. DM4]